MSDHDPFDDQLGEALRRRTAGSPIPTAAAHERVVRRAGMIRRRRAAIGGGGAMAVLLVGGVLLLPRGVDEQVPAVTGDVLPSFDDRSTVESTTAPDDDPVDGAAPRSVDLSIPPVSSVPSSTATTPRSTVPRSTSSVAAVTAPTVSAAPTTIATSSPSTSTATTASTTASTTETTSDTISDTTTDTSPSLAPFTNTYQSTGGSITVKWNGTALSLQAASPAPGYVAEVEETSATRVRVRFRSDAGDSRIEVRIVDAQVLVDID